MRKGNSTFLTKFISEAGTFRYNHDYFAFVELDDFACWIVADGINSEEKKSAEIVAHYLFSEFTENPTLSPNLLKKYLDSAQLALKNESGAGNLSASLVMVVTDYSQIVWVVVGNARLYHFRKGNFSFRSMDQTVAQLLLEVGKVNPAEMDENEKRYQLYNYFGKPGKFEPWISKPYPLNDGDVMLLCTIGFWENLKVNELSSAVKEAEGPEGLVDNLEELLLKKQNDALNNYTIGAIYAEKVFKEERFFKEPGKGILGSGMLKKVALIAAGILLLTGLGFVINQQMQQAKLAQVEVTPKKIEVTTVEPSPEPTIEPTPEPSVEATIEPESDEPILPIGPAEPTLEIPKVPDAEVAEKKQQEEERERKRAQAEAKAAKEAAAKSSSANKTDLLNYEKSGDKGFVNGNFEGSLSSYRNAIVLAKKIGDQKKLNLLERKLELAKQILTGDNLFNDRNYNSALEKYQSAIKKADALGLATSYLVAKQNKTEKCVFVVKLIAEGDAAYKKGDMTKAKSYYTHANSLAEQYGFAYTKQQLKSRLSKLGGKAVEANPEKLYSEAQRLESQGDTQAQIKEYGEAVKFYNSAKSIYQQLSKSDEVAKIEKKIAKAERGMNTLEYKMKHN